MRALAVPALALLLVSCPEPTPIDRDDAGPGGADDNDDVAADQYCESIVGFFCPYYVRCGRMAAADVDECRGVFLAACNARFEPTYVSLAAAQLLRLSRAGIDACSAHLDAVPCAEQILDLDGPCSGMWIGSVAEGGACGFDIESFVCAPGTSCTLGLDFCGVCERVVADGAACDVDGVTCSRTSSCEDGVCVARARVGESCAAGERCVLGAGCDDDGVCRGPTFVGAGDACDFDNRCPFRSECIGGACVVAGGVGAACSDVLPCDSGAFCDGASCVPLVEQGGVCDVGAQCQTGICLGAADGCSVVPGVCFE